MASKIPKIKTREISPEEFLARIVTGSLTADVKFNERARRSITVRLEPELLEQIDLYSEQSKKNRTAIVELLLTIGVQTVERQIKSGGQLELDEVAK